MITVEVKGMDEFNASVLSLIGELNMPYQDVFPQEARLLAQECMKRTPPFPKGSILGSNDSEARKSGEVTVGGDVDRSQTPISVAFEDESTNKWLKKIIRKKDVEKLKKAFEHIPKMKQWTVENFSPSYHKRFRGRQGSRYKVKESSKIMTLDNRQQTTYSKGKKKDVGWMKSGFGIAVSLLQGRVPAWVSRNFGNNPPGGMEMDVSDNNPAPYVRIWNDAPSIGRFAQAYEYAVQERTRAIGEKVLQALERRTKKHFKSQ
jgi:hypothetical protein